MSGRKCISTLMRPSPWHASQRPPLTLNEKRPGPVPALARRLDLREELADGSEEPVYVAGFERGVRPIGLWSTLITLSKNSMPCMSSYGAGSVVLP
jgi:hypothetical protein